jgi:hypothetical protein
VILRLIGYGLLILAAWALLACVLAPVVGLRLRRQYTPTRQRPPVHHRRYLTVYLDRRDIWVGYYRGDTHHYVCPLPTVVVRWTREPTADDLFDRLAAVAPRDPGGHARRIPKAGAS